MGLAETEATPSLYDSACAAWAARAQLDENAAVSSFRHHLWTKLRISRDSYEIDTATFDGEALPHLRVGTTLDGLAFCFDADRQLCVVNWRCADKNCDRVKRVAVRDRVTLGRAIAMGDQLAARFPKCDLHS